MTGYSQVVLSAYSHHLKTLTIRNSQMKKAVLGIIFALVQTMIKKRRSCAKGEF